MAESLAVRHRPRRFADVAGQRHVVSVLRATAARRMPAQQMLLSGPSGLGKTTLARIFAAALFCLEPAPDGDACGKCSSCEEVTGTNGIHPDVIEMDAASTGGKDEIRELATRATLSPFRARWKVYIIDEAHGLTSAGSQAFLKTLEEPPAHVLFIFATTDPDKLPAAIRGRCSIHELLPPDTEQIRANLSRIADAENWTLPEPALEAVIAASDPALGMRGTVMTLEKLSCVLEPATAPTDADLEQILGSIGPSRLAHLTDAVADGDRGAALLALADLTTRAGAGHLRRQLTAWYRADLLNACRARRGVEEAFRRYELIVNAGTHPGAVEVAVAQMAKPSLAESAEHLASLLEQTQDLIDSWETRGAAAAPDADSLPPTELPTAATPEAAPRHQAPPVPEPKPEPEPAAGHPMAHPETVGGPAPGPTAPEPLAMTDPRVHALTNAVLRRSARAGLLLRRCTFHAGPADLIVVTVAAAERASAAALDLSTLLSEAATQHHLTVQLG